MSILRRNWDITLILLLFVTLALAYSIVNPLHEATDELRHYRFVRYLVENRALPVQGQEACRSQSHHPPLFYVLGALATATIEIERDLCDTPTANPFWAYRYADVGVDNKNQYLHGPEEAYPWHGEALAAHIIRTLNVLIGAGTVWLTWATARVIWPNRRALAAGGAAFVAFNPMFLYMAGAINNDVIAAFSGSAVLFATVSLLRHPQGLRRRWGVILGILYGLALMSKFNMAVVAVLIALAVTYVAWKKDQWRLWLEVALISVLVAALVAGWWFVRNQMLYGEPTGFKTVTELWGMRDPRESFPLAVMELPLAWSTLWGRFGFGQIPLPQIVYDTLAWLVFAGLSGLIVPVIRKQSEDVRIFLGLLILNVILAFAVLFNYMLVSPAGAMGRFFFPGLPALSILTFYGLSNIVTVIQKGTDRLLSRRSETVAHSLPEPKNRTLALIINAGMLLLSLVALLGYLAPAYARPPAFASTAQVPNPVNASYAGLATLRGYRFSAETLRPGEPLQVDFYWEVEGQLPGNFLLFLHLIDEAGTIVAQRDTHPGTGTFPTSQWREGDRFVDSLRVYIPETAYTPNTVTVTVGLYAPSYRLGITGPNGEPWGDALPLGTVQLQPAADLAPDNGAVPNPMDQNFENEVRLRGYHYEQRVLEPGAVHEMTLYWERLQQASGDYVVQIQLLDESGNLRRHVEEPLPVQTWSRQVITPVTYQVPLPADLAAGGYMIRMIMLDGGTDAPKHLVAPDGHFTGEQVDLARIRIRDRVIGNVPLILSFK